MHVLAFYNVTNTIINYTADCTRLIMEITILQNTYVS